jgi:CYTH domain-containing protein
MAEEIEEKHRVIAEKMPDLAKAKKTPVEQHYIFLGNDGEVRIRRKGSKYFITIKGDGTLVRPEREKEISQRTYEELVELAVGTVTKDRYEIELPGGKIAELDIYRENLEGLGHMTVEVEFSSEAEARAFVKPDWFGKKITQDKRFKNKNLAVNGWPVGK